VDADVVGAFTATELKAYRADVTSRRQQLETERQGLLSKRETLQQTMGQTDALETHCARVRDRLTTFSIEEQQVAFDALALKVCWIPSEPLQIDASIPLDGIVSHAAPRLQVHAGSPISWR
jgi:hypothetical protein